MIVLRFFLAVTHVLLLKLFQTDFDMPFVIYGKRIRISNFPIMLYLCPLLQRLLTILQIKSNIKAGNDGSFCPVLVPDSEVLGSNRMSCHRGCVYTVFETVQGREVRTVLLRTL